MLSFLFLLYHIWLFVACVHLIRFLYFNQRCNLIVLYKSSIFIVLDDQTAMCVSEVELKVNVLCCPFGGYIQITLVA